MVDASEIIHPVRWTPSEALQLLKDSTHLEAAGVVVCMPAAWRGNRGPRPRMFGSVGSKAPLAPGQNALLDCNMDVAPAANRSRRPKSAPDQRDDRCAC